MKTFKVILKIFSIGFLIIITVFTFIFGLYCSVENNKKERNEIYEQGYKDACADFYQGKLKYDLIEHKDGTKTWERIKTNE